jgi:hypothetical protein
LGPIFCCFIFQIMCSFKFQIYYHGCEAQARSTQDCFSQMYHVYYSIFHYSSD